MHKFVLTPLALALASVMFFADARADTAQDIQALRNEMDALKADYEQRIKSLELRLEAARDRAGREAVATTTAATPASPSTSAQANSFNPAISLILSGLYARTSNDPGAYAITGFPNTKDAEIGPGVRGFSLSESELGLAASIDPWWRGEANIALHADNSVSVEEAYVQTTALGHGVTLKAGRFLSGIGYLNEQHSHTWDFADNPLAYQAMLGTQYGDDGVQLRWLAPTDLYLQVGLELGRGRNFPGSPGSNSERNGAGMVALTAHAGGDIGDSHSWRAGLSVLNAKANDLLLASSQDAASFTGATQIYVLDAIWKWAPNGNATRTNFKLQGEFLRSTHDGVLASANAMTNAASNYNIRQSGWYLQGIYQFEPRWRAGLRTERLNPGAAMGDVATLPAGFAGSSYKPRKHSAMLDFNLSEFSRIRLQTAIDYARQGQPDHQLLLQYQMSLGAHGAHQY